MKKETCNSKLLKEKQNTSKPSLDLGSRLADYEINQSNTGSDNNIKLAAKYSQKTLQQRHRNTRFSRAKQNSLFVSFTKRFSEQIQSFSSASFQR